MPGTIRFHSFPRTKPPPPFVAAVVGVFQAHEPTISTIGLKKGLVSNEVHGIIRDDLIGLGFEMEKGKRSSEKIDRPVFFGGDGKPTLRYQIDGYHPGWKCGLEIEAGRAWMGNAVYRDLIQAMVMVDVDHLVLAVANSYKYKSAKRDASSGDYDNTVSLADAVFGHTRVVLPYGLTVIGY